jgi:hypothetical protein
MYFNTNYELLEERCYYGNYEQPYILTDVTDEVSYDGAHRARPLVEVPPLSGE